MASTDYTVRGSGVFAAVANLSAGVSYLDTTLPITGLSLPVGTTLSVGMAVMVDAEIMRLTSVGSGSVGVARGCADTIPAPHSTDAVAWFFSTSIGTDEREYAATETIAVKVLPKTSGGSPVPISGSPPNDITFNSRFARPYPPGQMVVQGDSWFEVTDPVVSAGSLTLTWVPRNRITQADVLVGHTEGAVTAEAGTTYRARVYSAADALLATYSGLTGTTWAYTHAAMTADFAALLSGTDVSGYILFDAVRDGYASWQSYRVNFQFESPLALGVGTASAVGMPASLEGIIAMGVGSVGVVGLQASLESPLVLGVGTVSAVGLSIVEYVTDGLVAMLDAVDYVSGQVFENSVASPADGSAQSAYDYMLGNSTGNTTNDPDFVGTPGVDPCYWDMPAKYFTLNGSITPFLRDLHKSGSKFTVEFWHRTHNASSSNVAPLFDTGTSDQGGSDMSRGVIYMDVGSLNGAFDRQTLRVLRDSSGARALNEIADSTLASNTLYMLAASVDGTGVEDSFFYKNGNYDQVSAVDTWDGTFTSPGSSDAVNTPRIGVRGDGNFAVAGGRVYLVRLYNRNLSKAELDQNWNATRARFGL